MQAARGYVLQRDRVIRSKTDDGIGTDLMHRRLHGLEVREHTAVELDVVATAEISDDVLAKDGPEHKRVVAVPAGQGIIAGADADPIVAVAGVDRVVAVSDGQSIVAITAEHTVVSIAGKNRIVVAAAVEHVVAITGA